MKSRTRAYLMVVTALIILAVIVAITASKITGNVISGNAIKSANEVQNQVDLQKDALVQINNTINGVNASVELKDAINKQIQAIYNASLNIENSNRPHYSGGGSSGGFSGGGIS